MCLPAELDLLLPAIPKQCAAGFGWQCFTNSGGVESNFGRSDIIENEEYTQTQIKTYLEKRQNTMWVMGE